jgi:hypothetical protein
MATAIRTEVNAAFYQAVAARIDMAARARLARLLLANPVTRRSEFDRLKDVAKAAALGKFKQRLELLADIDAIGPTEAWLEGIPPGKIAHFAGEARVTDIADLRKVLNEDKRLTLIASLVHVVRAGVRDDVVTMFCKRMAAIHQKGRDHLEALREAHRAEAERLLGVLGDILSAVREATVPSGDGDGQDLVPAADTEGAAGRLVLKTLERAGGVEALSAAHEAVAAHHGNNYLPLLDQHYRSPPGAVHAGGRDRAGGDQRRARRGRRGRVPARPARAPRPPTCPSAWRWRTRPVGGTRSPWGCWPQPTVRWAPGSPPQCCCATRVRSCWTGAW